MALKYRAKRPELIDALARAGVSTAEKLSTECGIAKGTAQALFRGDPVTVKVAIEVVHFLQKFGAEAAVSTTFAEVEG